MIAEDYINKEIMKLLLEKGCPLDKVLVQDFRPVWYTKDYNDPTWQDCDAYYIPTQSQVMKWLREVHHYYIQVMLDGWACGGHMGYYVVLQRTDNDYEMMLQDVVDEVFYKTYEEACEAAIKYCLEKLI